MEITWLFGIVGTHSFAEECPRGLAEITTYTPLLGLVVGAVTFGIVVPRRAEYRCVAPSGPVAQSDGFVATTH